jgi:tetratricopeptide (TPR) repeat protein
MPETDYMRKFQRKYQLKKHARVSVATLPVKTTKAVICRKLSLLFILSFALCLVVGCRDNNCKQLARANSLTDARENDSALHILAAMDHRSLSQYEQAVYNLIKVKALYRSYHVLKTDSLINFSIATFRSGNNDSLLADACYYKAAMASDRDKDKGYVKVMGYLRMAEDIAVKNHYVDIEKKIYDRASNYNIVSGEYKKALLYAKKQQKLAQELNDNYFKAYSLNQLLKAYYMLEEKDSVYKYHRLCWQMRKYIPSEEMPDYLNDLYVTLGLLNPREAIRHFEDLLRTHPAALYQGNLACLYDKTGQRGRADSLWKKALQTGNMYEKSGILSDMIQRKQADHLYQEAMEAQNVLNAINDSLRRSYRNDDVDNIVKHDAPASFSGTNVSTIVWLVRIFSVILLVSIVFIFFYHRKLHKRSLMFFELSDELARLQDTMAMDQDKISMLEEALEKLKVKHAQTFSHGRQLYEGIRNHQSIILWKKQDFIDFIDYYMSVDFKYLQTLHDMYKDLTLSEIFFLILIHEGCDEHTVMEILAISRTALRVRKSRINKKRREEYSKPSAEEKTGE